MNNFLAAIFLFVGGAGVFCTLLIFSTILNGWILHLLWQWFVISIFPSVASITVGQAIGVSMIVGFLTYKSIPENTQSFSESLLKHFLHSFITLGIGWLVHYWIS